MDKVPSAILFSPPTMTAFFPVRPLSLPPVTTERSPVVKPLIPLTLKPLALLTPPVLTASLARHAKL